MKNATKAQHANVTKLLDQLIELDRTMHRAYYEMGRLLYMFRTHKLYEVLEYESFVHLVEEELSFSPTSARNYASFYANLHRLKYTKAESLDMLERFGLRNLMSVLPKVTQKAGVRAIKNRIEAMEQHQMTFWMHGEEYTEVEQALTAMGALKTDSGRFVNSTEALVTMAREINGTTKQKAA